MYNKIVNLDVQHGIFLHSKSLICERYAHKLRYAKWHCFARYTKDPGPFWYLLICDIMVQTMKG